MAIYLVALAYESVLYARYFQQAVDEQCGIGVAQVRWQDIDNDPLLSWSNGEMTCHAGFGDELTCSCP